MSSLHSFLPASPVCFSHPACLISPLLARCYSTSLPAYSYCCRLAILCALSPDILFFTFSSLLSFIWVMNNFLANSRAACAGDTHTSAAHSPKYQLRDSMDYKQLHTHDSSSASASLLSPLSRSVISCFKSKCLPA